MNYKEYLKCFRLALDDEIKASRKQGGQKTYLKDGRYLGKRAEQYLYSFTAETQILFPDDTQIDLEFGKIKYTGNLLSSEGFDLILVLQEKLDSQIDTAILLTSPWFLLEELKKRLNEIYLNKQANKELAEQLLQNTADNFIGNSANIEQLFGQIQARLDAPLLYNQSQYQAIKRGLNQKINFIWGPPGTGKTSTLGLAVTVLVESGESVLVVAHSNTAVDTAMKNVAKYLQGYSLYKEGFILRYGIPTPRSLDDFPKLITRTVIRQQNPQLIKDIEFWEKERRSLIERLRREKVSKELDSIRCQLNSVKKKLSALYEDLRNLEIELIQKAGVVGCTLAKAAIAPEVYQRQQQFDAVVIDEASMAHIPQCFFACTLAKRRILIFGDFRQLGPISQADTEMTKQWLVRDIFEQAEITQKVNRGIKDSRLTLLDTQYRMNPGISEISNRLFYQGLLKDSSEVADKTLSIVRKEPVAGQPLVFFDTSQLSAFCFKEKQSHSRFNLISALVSVALAQQSLRENHSSVGIITPYNAQARLIKHLLKDLSMNEQVKIATVHCFQGSEENVIIFDTVEGKPQANPGLPIKGGMQSSAARLANVAISRAQGKFISIVNYQYIVAKLDSFNIFRKFIDRVKIRSYVKILTWEDRNIEAHIIDCLSKVSRFSNAEKALSLIKFDLEKAQEEIAIYWSGEQIERFFPLSSLKNCSNKKINFFLSGTGRHWIAKELGNVQCWNTDLKSNIGLIGIDKKILWIYLSTVTAFDSVIKIDLPQTASLLHGFFPLIPPKDPGSKHEDLGKCLVCGKPLWVHQDRLGSYLVCTKSIAHHKKKITAQNATTIARFMKITCGDCNSQVKGCLSAKNNSLFLACTNAKCKWTHSFKSII